MNLSQTENQNQQDNATQDSVELVNPKQWMSIQKFYHLTPRELEIAKLICKGLNNEQVAKVLDIQHGTVKTHLRNIYRRVRVKSKITLLLRFVQDAHKLTTNGDSAPRPQIPIVEHRPVVTQPVHEEKKV